MAWLRLHTNILDSHKIQVLPDKLFRFLVNLWCLAKENDGALPEIDAIAWRLRMKPGAVREMIADLRSRNLIDEVSGCFMPHDWKLHQYEWNASTKRVRAFRERKKAVSGSVSETVSPSVSASVSVSVSDSVSSEKNGKQSNSNPPRRFTADFEEFRLAFAECATMQWSDPDWLEASYPWKTLDFEQKADAIKGLRDRLGTWDAVLQSKPSNYLKSKMWQRSIKPDDKQKRGGYQPTETLPYEPDPEPTPEEKAKFQRQYEANMRKLREASGL